MGLIKNCLKIGLASHRDGRGERERRGSGSSSSVVKLAMDDRIPPGKVFVVVKCKFAEFQGSRKFQNFCCFCCFPEGSDRLGSEVIATKAIKSRQKIDAVGVSPRFRPDQPQFSVKLVVHGRRVPPEVIIEDISL